MFECVDTRFPAAGIEYYHYDQLGSYRSDRADDPTLWDLGRFVVEVEQVRVALGLDGSNLVLLGHSWGGLLALAYALHHQQHLEGLVISNMMSSIGQYNQYAADVLMPQMDPGVLAEITQFEAEGTTDDPQGLRHRRPPIVSIRPMSNARRRPLSACVTGIRARSWTELTPRTSTVMAHRLKA